MIDLSLVSPSPSPSSMYGEDVFTWGRELGSDDMRRPSASSANTSIVSASELDNQTWINMRYGNQHEMNVKSAGNQQDTETSGVVPDIPEVRIQMWE